MKLPIRSLRVPRSRKREQLQFFGKESMLNVQETGLIVEGLIPEIWFPFLMPVIYRAVSEWTMRTIPFSRIRSCRVISRTPIRTIFGVAWCIFFANITLILLVFPPLYLGLVALNIVGTYFFLRWFFKDCVDIEFATQSENRCAVRIRFTKASDQLLLFQELSRHRLEVAAPELAKVAKDVIQTKSMVATFLRSWRGE